MKRLSKEEWIAEQNKPYNCAEVLEVRETGAVKARVLVVTSDGEYEKWCTLWFAPFMIDQATGKPKWRFVDDKFRDLKYGQYGRAFANYSL